MTTVDQVRTALEGVMDPELHRNLVELGMVRDIAVDGGSVSVTVALTTIACPLKDRIASDVKDTVGALAGVDSVQVELTEMAPEEKQRIGLGAAPERTGTAEAHNNIDHVIAVMSGKGGGGKSRGSGLLALALRRDGHQVGILDADITGPSIPKMFLPDGAYLEPGPAGPTPPQTRTGIRIMSINLILDQEDTAVIWRGPLISGAIKQFWGDIAWGALDYLIVDLPPGTSDASLTVLQSLPISGVVLVTSPQGLAGMVVRKAASMAQQLKKPVLGLVENMSYFECPDTGKRYDIFGPSHAEQTARQIGAPFLGRLPIDPEIAKLCDTGNLEQYPPGAFESIANNLATHLPKA